MPALFSTSFRVRIYECDSLGHLNNAVYQHYLEQATADALTAVGYPPSWFHEGGTVWQPRRISIEYLRPASAGDLLEVSTWATAWEATAMHREYLVRRQETGTTIARAGADIHYCALGDAAPQPIPPTLIAEVGSEPDTVLSAYPLPPASLESGLFLWRHKVAHYELDITQHVKSAVYLNWIEEAKFEACQLAGWPVERMMAADFVTFQIRHDTNYFLPARYGDEIEISSRLYDLRRVRGTWLHEVRRPATGDLLVRNYSTGAFLNLQGRPARAPQAMLDALLRRSPAT